MPYARSDCLLNILVPRAARLFKCDNFAADQMDWRLWERGCLLNL